MTRIGKAMLAGLAMATAAMGIAAPAQARTYVEFGIASYDGDPYYRDHRYRNWERERWHRHHYRDWRRHHGYWRERDYWRDRRYWRGRDRCWTEWHWNRWDGRYPVRVCR